MRHSRMKRLLSFMMAVVMILSLGVTGAYAVQPGQTTGLTVERLDPSEVTADLVRPGLTVTEKNNFGYTHKNTESVRVIIVLERDPAISLFSVRDGADLTEYREELEELQDMMAEYISEEALDGEKMEVVGNLTLVSNAISAVVEYGQIDAIRNVEGVASVFVEPMFKPLEAVPTNANAQQMTGAANVQQYKGYTGAGTRIAVIDTGTDTDHQSLSEGGYEYALSLLAEEKGVSYEDYVSSLNLLDVEEINSVLTQLHAYKNSLGDLTAEDLYVSSKLPFAFNYVDNDLDVTNDVDKLLSHGSHVAGIATANRFIESGTVYDFDGNEKFDEDDVNAVMEFVVGNEDLANYELADLSGDGTVSSYDVYLLNVVLNGHKNGGYYVDAAETVMVSGSAPDAQLITMKVFGKKTGGAYALDYMQAVEDAILLNCDVVNLSLGTSSAGFVEPHYDGNQYEGWNSFINDVMADVTETNVVLSVSAGNSYNWPYFDLWNPNDDKGEGMLYTDEGGVSSVAEPASYKNSLAVASVDNTRTFKNNTLIVSGANNAEGIELVPTDSYYTQDVLDAQIPLPWYSMDEVDATNDGTDYELVFLGDPTELLNGGEQTDTSIYAGYVSDFDGYDFTGKIVLVARGGMYDEEESDEGESNEGESDEIENGIYFVDKYKNAALAGAAAVLIYNNVDGQIAADLTNPDTNIPVGTITLAEAQEIYSMFAKNSAGLYAGTMTVYNHRTTTTSSNMEMSIFSSWGPTGDLTMKPEITAPGGAIYSINGNDPSGTAYELMSGTSMAAPHLAGLTALLNQHFNEKGLLTKTGMSARHLAHSLLMSTATPIIEAASGLEYSVRSQGAGLANVEKAVSSNAYITVTGQDDGKVKAELCDGTANRTVTFTIHNFGDKELTYDLSARVLTTSTETIDGINYSSDVMTTLPATVSFSPSSVTVAADSTATVTATIDASAAVAAMEAKGYTNGFYLEGFLYITSTNGDVSHSIPMLGWYGDWSAPSMYDKGSFMDYVEETAQPGHVYAPYKNMMTWLPAGYKEALPYTGNLYGGMTQDKTTGDVYMVGDQRYLEERNALSSDPDHWWEIYGIMPTLIRNAGDVHFTITNKTTGEIILEEDFEDEESDTLIASYFDTGSGMWSTSDYVIGPDEWKGTDADGNPLPEDTEVVFTLSTAPEYFVKDDKTVDYNQLGDGADLSFRFRVDNTAPALNSITYENGKLNFDVQDNNHIAAVILLDGAASMTYENIYPDMDVRGQKVTGSFDLARYNYTSSKVAIAVCDYAGNESYFAINLNGEGASYGDLVGFQYDAGTMWELPGAPTWTGIDLDVDATSGKEIVKSESPIFSSMTEFVCAEYVNGHVYAQDSTGKFYGIFYKDILANSVDLDACYIKTMDRVYNDLAYNYADGTLYGLTAYEDAWGLVTDIVAININMGYFESTATMCNDVEGLTLAFDDNGTLYMLGRRLDGMTGEMSSEACLWALAPSQWGYDQLSPDAYLSTELYMDFLQSMTWDHNSETLYWARFYYSGKLTDAMEKELIAIDVSDLKFNATSGYCVDGDIALTKIGDLSRETCALFAPLTEETAAKEEHSRVPTYNPNVTPTPMLNTHSLTLGLGKSAELTVTLDPWYATNTEVMWMVDDDSVVTVENGVVTAVGEGTTFVHAVTDFDNRVLDSCEVTVTALTVKIEGIISHTDGGIGSVYGSQQYTFDMVDGIVDMDFGTAITAPEEMNFGLQIGSAVSDGESIWACETSNAGMIYEIDPDTGVVKSYVQPVDGDMMLGLSHSEATGLFTGIMNFWLFVDQPLTEDVYDEMQDSYEVWYNKYDEDDEYGTGLYMWNRIDMSDYLVASAAGFETGETGNGSVGGIVFAGITSMDNDGTYVYEDTYRDYLGNWAMCALPFFGYTPATTHVLLDNVGRLWYIDEVVGMQLIAEEGMLAYVNDDMSMIIDGTRNGVFSVKNEDDTYNVFYIRELAETPLTDMFREGTMPRITYHFSDICYAGKSFDGMPMFALSLYDYWNEGAENQLYLYVAGGEFYDEEIYDYIIYEDALYELGGTGIGNIIATITDVTVGGELANGPAIEEEYSMRNADNGEAEFDGTYTVDFFRG